MSDDYVEEHHHGSLEDAFKAEYARIHQSSLLRATRYMHYSGPDCAPFDAYMRWSHNKAVIANINGVEPHVEKQGRMPKIIAVLSLIVDEIEIECVNNPYLFAYFDRRKNWIKCGDGRSFRWHIGGPL